MKPKTGQRSGLLSDSSITWTDYKAMMHKPSPTSGVLIGLIVRIVTPKRANQVR